MNGMGPIQKAPAGETAYVILSVAGSGMLRTHPIWRFAGHCEDCALYMRGKDPGWIHWMLFHIKRRDTDSRPLPEGELRIARWCGEHEALRRREADRLRIQEEDVIPPPEESILIVKAIFELTLQLEAITKK